MTRVGSPILPIIERYSFPTRVHGAGPVATYPRLQAHVISSRVGPAGLGLQKTLVIRLTFLLAQMTDLVEDTCSSLLSGLMNTVSVPYFPIKRADTRTY